MAQMYVHLTDPVKYLKVALETVKQYEDPEYQRRAKALIPQTVLSVETMMEMRKCQRFMKENDKRVDEAELSELTYLKALISWFKKDFFKWVDSPDCESCGGTTKFQGSRVQFRSSYRGPPVTDNVFTVEEHRCTVCFQITEFPRYNDVAMLLRTRKGRCAEWSNAFTLMCRSVGYRVRYVFDNADHIWTEIFSFIQRRWVHIDACEGVIDQPLLYENGWKKTLSYVLAVGVDDIQDVTWRYTGDHKAVRARRSPEIDAALAQCIIDTRKELLRLMSPCKQRAVLRLVTKELAELMVQPSTSEEYGGRTSGAKNWISRRHEDGSIAYPDVSESTKHTTIVLFDDTQLSYSAAHDKYCLKSIHQEKITPKWERLTFLTTNIIRNEERDWKMAYLARKDASRPGVIVWDFKSDSKNIKTVEILSGGFVKDNCEIIWVIQCADNSFSAEHRNVDRMMVQLMAPCRSIRVEVTLKSPADNPPIAWQFAQLFREKLDVPDCDYQFGFKFTLI